MHVRLKESDMQFKILTVVMEPRVEITSAMVNSIFVKTR